MHVEVPKSHSFKEFGGEYLMIVISIITALALEHGVQSWHHSHVAHEAAARIDAEIKANVEELDLVLKHNDAELLKLKTLNDELLASIRNKTASPAMLEKLNLAERTALSVHSPSLRREAWEVAVASQAASWMSQSELERYSALYANMRDVQAINDGSGNNFLNASAMLDTFSNFRMGDGDPKAVYRTVVQMMNAYSSADGNLQNLRDSLAKSEDGAHH
jgi:hypothetical protein